MKTLHEEKLGNATIRIVVHDGVYRGAILVKGARVAPLTDTDVERLLARLRNEAGKLHPDYFGMSGAIDRFRHFFPDGFDDVAYRQDERDYKVAAQARLHEVLPIEKAAEAGAADAAAVRRAFATNILHSTELARAHELLGSAEGAAYVRSAAAFATGDVEFGLAGMAKAIAPHGRSSWPLLTYLPSLWRPDVHMVLKPAATVDFAQRIGHAFQFDYSAAPDASVYRSLLELAADTQRNIASLQPTDRAIDLIDVQSFIWVVGDYTEAELPRLERLRASP